MTVDLKKEQLASLERPRYPYSTVARLFVLSMDLVAGRRTSLAKAKMVEALAGVPYRAWENRHYMRMLRHFRDDELASSARAVHTWAHEVRENEYWHLLVLEEKMRQEGCEDPWYLSAPFPQLAVGSYSLLTWAMALLNIQRGYLLNAEFEDHAEHTYAELVRDHPEWESQPVASEVVTKDRDFETWAEVFRRIGIDERDHMNDSFVLCDEPGRVVRYEGMPASV